MMPEMDGITFLEAVKNNNPDVARILFTGYASLDNAMVAINRLRLFGYMTKPWSYEILKGTIARTFTHYNLTIENKRLQKLTDEQNQKLKFINENLENLIHERTSQLEEAVREGIIMLALAAEAKDDDTADHIYRIRDLTLDICNGLGLSSEETEQISFFSIMHDVGKIHVPDNILKKQGLLTEEEMAAMKTHSIAGENILGSKDFYRMARQIARSHHERWDGNGYPDGLKGTSIPLPARIVAVADIFDALINKRPYKQAWSTDKAIAEMKVLSGKAFDPEILDVFLKIIESS